eukprot:1191201-Prorocentrum_minimum.AAC.1
MNRIVAGSEALAKSEQFRGFANLRAVDVCATRLWLDKAGRTPYSANAAWGFDRGVRTILYINILQ